VNLPEIFAIVDQVKRRQAELRELRRAVGPWPWRVGQIRASAGKDLSERMTLILALVVFDGYELFPAHGKRSDSQSPRGRDL
jgi:hypothetical protein